MNTIPASVLEHAVVQKISCLRELLREFRRESIQNTSPHFIRGTLSVLDAVEAFAKNRMAYCDTQYSSDTVTRDEQKRFYCRIALRIIIAVHNNYLPLIYASKQHNQYLILPTIRRALDLFQTGIELSLVPDFQFNYMYMGGMERFVERVVDLLENNLDQDNKGAVRKVACSGDPHPRWITFIHFPLAERDSALSLVIVAHELGHLVDQINQIYKSFLPIDLDATFFKKNLEELCKVPIPQVGANSQLTFEQVFSRASLEADFSASCISAVQNWVREIIADMIAVHALGPAYLFAFVDFLAHGGATNNPSPSHPAPLFRMDFLMKELETLGYFKITGKTTSILEQLRDSIKAELPSTAHKGAMEVAEKTITKYLSKIQMQLRAIMTSYSFKADKYQAEVPCVVQKLLSGVAPIEYRGPDNQSVACSVPAILNGGWEVYKAHMPTFSALFKDEIASQDKLNTLNELIFKAVEASEVMRLWRKA